MLILLALVAAVFAEKPRTIDEFLAQPIPKYAQELTGQALVDYVNEHQPFFKAKYSPDAEAFAKSRIMDTKYLEKPKDAEVLKDVVLDGEPPESFDARQHWPECKSIGYIRDQSACGSCWAVSSAEVMSDRVCVQSNSKVKKDMSDTDIVACCGISCGYGCEGGWPLRAFEFMQREGVCTGGRYRQKNVCQPYPFYPCGFHENQPYYGPCPQGLWPTPICRKACQRKYPKSYEDDKVFATKAYYVPQDEKLIRQEIMKNGPVVAAFTVYLDFMYYKGGIYVHTAGPQTGAHAVKVIGWGTENGTDYWLIANSWNTDWGENGGYFRILRGKNHCEIEDDMVGGLIKF